MPSKTRNPNPFLILVALILLSGISACLSQTPTPIIPDQTKSPASLTSAAPGSTPSPLPPSPTPVPLAATVNGDPITQAELEAELKRYQAAQEKLGISADPGAQRQVVLDDLINQKLFAQGAAAKGFSVDETGLDKRLDQLAVEIGGTAALTQWLANHNYTETDFRQALRLSILAAWQRDEIMDSVPETAEQVHARQILVYERESAEKALSRLVPGLNFATLAFKYDPITGGDLGWFPRGYLIEKAVEEAAFALQPGEISEIVETRAGFHLIEVIDRDPQRKLSPDARLALQKQAVRAWLEEQRSQSQIVIDEP